MAKWILWSKNLCNVVLLHKILFAIKQSKVELEHPNWAVRILKGALPTNQYQFNTHSYMFWKGSRTDVILVCFLLIYIPIYFVLQNVSVKPKKYRFKTKRVKSVLANVPLAWKKKVTISEQKVDQAGSNEKTKTKHFQNS